MPIEIQTPNSLSPVLKSYPYWNSNILQDFITIDTISEYAKISQSLRFKLRARGNAYIIFIIYPRPYFHVCIGEDFQNDTCSTYNPVNSIKNFIKTIPNLLNPNEFRGFWIRWSNKSVYVGRENDLEPFLIWNDTHLDLSLSNLKIGFCTLEANGTWIVDDSDFKPSILSEPSIEGHVGVWIPACGGNIPSGAIAAGLDNDEEQYIARAYYRNQLYPGKLHPSHGCCYITSDAREFAIRDYEVLCTLTGEWVWMRNGDMMHPNAVKSICKRTGETYLIGRGYHNGALILGKVFPSTKLCYIGYDGREILAVDYELFINNSMEH